MRDGITIYIIIYPAICSKSHVFSAHIYKLVTTSNHTL